MCLTQIFMNYVDFRVRKERIPANFYMAAFHCWLELISLVRTKTAKSNRLFKTSALIPKSFPHLYPTQSLSYCYAG